MNIKISCTGHWLVSLYISVTLVWRLGHSCDAGRRQSASGQTLIPSPCQSVSHNRPGHHVQKMDGPEMGVHIPCTRDVTCKGTEQENCNKIRKAEDTRWDDAREKKNWGRKERCPQLGNGETLITVEIKLAKTWVTHMAHTKVNSLEWN